MNSQSKKNYKMCRICSLVDKYPQCDERSVSVNDFEPYIRSRQTVCGCTGGQRCLYCCGSSCPHDLTNERYRVVENKDDDYSDMPPLEKQDPVKIREILMDNYNGEMSEIIKDSGLYNQYSAIPQGDEDKFTWFLRSGKLGKYTFPDVYFRKKTKEELASEESLVKAMTPGTSVGRLYADVIPKYLYKYFDYVYEGQNSYELPKTVKTVLKKDEDGYPVGGPSGYYIKDVERNSTPFVVSTTSQKVEEKKDESNKNKYLKYKQKYLNLKKYY
jgi:hypothetical protein